MFLIMFLFCLINNQIWSKNISNYLTQTIKPRDFQTRYCQDLFCLTKKYVHYSLSNNHTIDLKCDGVFNRLFIKKKLYLNNV